MKIDNYLNLVVPISTDGGEVFVHSTPIRKEVFKQYFLVLSKTLNSIYAEGLHSVTGPRIAAMMLEKIATDNGTWESDGSVIGVRDGLMAEIRRLSNVFLPTETGWQSMPIYDALNRGYLSQDEVEEAEGFIVFFTCVLHIHRKSDQGQFMGPMRDLWGVQTSSLSAMEYIASLPKSTATETFVETVKASSIPS